MVNDVLAIRTLEAGNLAVFSERVVAFCATQELSRRFIRTTRLHLPHVGGVVAAFGAFDSHCWKRPQFLFLFAYHGYELLRIMLYDLADFGVNLLAVLLLLVPAFGADKRHFGLFSRLGFLGLKTSTAFRAKFHTSPLRYTFGDSFTWRLLNFFHVRGSGATDSGGYEVRDP
jgi:hypothetical protein